MIWEVENEFHVGLSYWKLWNCMHVGKSSRNLKMMYKYQCYVHIVDLNLWILPCGQSNQYPRIWWRFERKELGRKLETAKCVYIQGTEAGRTDCWKCLPWKTVINAIFYFYVNLFERALRVYIYIYKQKMYLIIYLRAYSIYKNILFLEINI